MVFNQMNSEANQEGISSIQGVSGLQVFPHADSSSSSGPGFSSFSVIRNRNDRREDASD